MAKDGQRIHGLGRQHGSYSEGSTGPGKKRGEFAAKRSRGLADHY